MNFITLLLFYNFVTLNDLKSPYSKIILKSPYSQYQKININYIQYFNINKYIYEPNHITRGLTKIVETKDRVQH